MGKHVLIIATDPEITAIIERLINGYDGFSSASVHSIDGLVAKLDDARFDILLLGAGLSEEQELQIRETATALAPWIKVIEHYGGGSGLLLEELKRE